MQKNYHSRMTTMCDSSTSEISLGIVKPHAYEHRQEIEWMIHESGLSIPVKKDPYRISRSTAEKHYAVHKGMPFYEELVKMITEGPAEIMLVCGENAIERLAKLTGPTDSRKAAKGTIRHRFGDNLMYNAFHRSDSRESARREALLYWEESELPEEIMNIFDRGSGKPV